MLTYINDIEGISPAVTWAVLSNQIMAWLVNIKIRFLDGTYYGMTLSVRPSINNTTKTSDAIDLGHSTKTKMAATAVCRLTLYPMQDIACERDILKTACQIDFTF